MQKFPLTADYCWQFCHKKTETEYYVLVLSVEVLVMKVVVVKSPKIISGVLRMIFKIKKEDNE